SEDCLDNGTALAGVAAGESYGVAKQAGVVGVRVLDCQGSGTTEDIIAAVDWVAKDAEGKAAVATIGFGGGPDDALDSAIDGGVSFAVPAGSSEADACQFSPGRTPDALTVGGTETGTDTRIERSNTGSCLDLFAPATDITTASHEDDTSGTGFSGTAAAAAHVAGAAALYLGTAPEADPATVTAEITGNATPDVVVYPGEESPNLLLYTGFLMS
ncbi:MAG: S8 family serine peptidase, partial [Stackebrandtia sp.]